MATAGVQLKIMPDSPNSNLEAIRENIKKVIEGFESGVYNNTEERPIAFGIKALIVTLAISEEIEIDEVSNSIEKIEGVSSVELIDYRRAVG